jgi:hypothetical protein
MKTFLVAAMLALASLTTGCATIVRGLSDEALQRATVEQRAEYRSVLTTATEAYDAKYKMDGTPKEPVAIVPVPAEPTK